MFNTKSIPSMLCKDLVVEVHDVVGKVCVVTANNYPNGDSINLYFHTKGSEIRVTDEGATADNLANRGIHLTPERRELVESICHSGGASLTDAVIGKTIKRASLGTDVFSFCQTVDHVAGLHYHAAHFNRSMIPDAVDALVRKRIQPKCEVSRRWTDPLLDPKGSFPVDYHLNGESLPAKNLFYVGSPSKALMVTAVVHFLMSKNVKIPTLTIIDPSADIKGRGMDRLQFSSSRILTGIKGNEDKIVRFALNKAA